MLCKLGVLFLSSFLAFFVILKNKNNGQNLCFTKIKILIFHAASSGEYEQLKPILKRINREKYFIIQSFTSPTIYNKESKSNLFDVCCYHPYDIWWKSYSFFKRIKPDIYCITRHDIWPIHLFMLNFFKIEVPLFNTFL